MCGSVSQCSQKWSALMCVFLCTLASLPHAPKYLSVSTDSSLHSFLTPVMLTLLCMLDSTILMSLLKIHFKHYNRVTGIVGRCKTSWFFHSAVFEVCFALIIKHETHPGHGHFVSMLISMKVYTRLTYIHNTVSRRIACWCQSIVYDYR